MTKAKFEIGATEKHTIIVNASALLKYIKIEVDGEKVVNEANFQPSAKKFQLDVGNSEKHPFGNQRWTILAYHTIRGRKRSSKNLKLHRHRERLVN